MSRTIAVIVGTRPEAIKMAMVYRSLRECPELTVRLIATVQHRQMLDQVLEVFGIAADVDLDLMRPGQDLADLSAAIVKGVSGALAAIKPDAVLVHGDTTTCLMSAIAAFYQRIPIGHVEAGLRTGRLDAPWPEEMNRRLTDPICRWCFAPTAGAARNLAAEGIAPERVHITGNTAVDALMEAMRLTRQRPPVIAGLEGVLEGPGRMILVTGHRRESFGEPLRQLCMALRDIVQSCPDVCIVYPVHLNPNVQGPVREILGRRDRIHLIEPVSYLEFVHLMNRSYFIITDSGGIQEEAPTLGKPVLVTRDVTERPEAVEAGVARLVGTDRSAVLEWASRLLGDDAEYRRMSSGANPFGDGRASHRVRDILLATLSSPSS